MGDQPSQASGNGTDSMSALGTVDISNHFLKSIFDALPEPIVVLNELGAIELANRAWLDFANLPIDNLNETLGANYFDLCEKVCGASASDTRTILDGLRALLAGRSATFNFEYSRCSPKEYAEWYMLRARRFEDSPAPCLVIVHENISERKQVERELEETAYNLRLAQEIAHVGSFTMDIHDPHRDTWSEETYRIFGRSPRQEPIPYTELARRIVHPEDRERFGEVLMQSIGEAIPFNIEHRILRPNGGVRYVMVRAEPVLNDQGDVIQFVGTVQDTTERKLSEIELFKVHELTRAIINNTVDGIITISERGIIQSFNEAAEHIFGYTADEVIGQNVRILMPKPYRNEHDDYIKNYLRTGHRKIIGIGREVVGRRKDGSVFPMELAVSEIRLGKQHIFTGLVRDISERRKMELEILQISDYERQNIGQELHDGLGSQLSGLSMICQNVARQLEKEGVAMASEVAEIAAQIKEADYQARNIARGLVPVAAEPDGLRQALKRMADTAERTYGIPCTFEEEGEVLIEDYITSSHLYRIAQEAFSNAVRHARCSHVSITLAKDAYGSVQLSVIDDGIGIPEQLPRNQGVGLRTMQYRANVIGGRLKIERGLKKGTIVTVLLQKYD